MSDKTKSKQVTSTGMAGQNKNRGGDGSIQMECLKNLLRLWEEENGPPGGSTPGRGKSEEETAAWYLSGSRKEELEKRSKDSEERVYNRQIANLNTAGDAESKGSEPNCKGSAL